MALENVTLVRDGKTKETAFVIKTRADVTYLDIEESYIKAFANTIGAKCQIILRECINSNGRQIDSVKVRFCAESIASDMQYYFDISDRK